MRELMIPGAMLLALVACDKDKGTTITTADGKQVTVTTSDASDKGASITMKGSDGSGTFTYGENAAKQALPLNLPVFPGAVVSTAMTGAKDGKSGGMFTIESKDGTAQQISDFYKGQAEKLGMKVEASGISGANMAGFRATGVNGQNIVLSARPGGPNGETHAMLIVGTN